MITIEIIDDTIYIAEENSSGCEYSYNTKEDLINAFKDYINNYYSEQN